MKFYWSLIFLLALTPNFASAEGGCPAGQYPIGGQGAVACAPMPQNNSQPQARPLGEWIKTWGAIAMGSIDSITTYGVSTGKLSESDARKEALAYCGSHGEDDCKVLLTYRNQCAAVATPKIDGKPSGSTHMTGRATLEEASADALDACKKNNPKAQCNVAYTDCTKQFFQWF
ncbi:DUF4189 domain-containing protein [Pseudomonas quasicaspiana]|nr:DUF4189 domain-containing protein [Pseudomonas syringae]MDG6401295.1 DUF4189 domain-containing protein [Pseudomonas quasicaspiana]